MQTPPAPPYKETRMPKIIAQSVVLHAIKNGYIHELTAYLNGEQIQTVFEEGDGWEDNTYPDFSIAPRGGVYAYRVKPVPKEFTIYVYVELFADEIRATANKSDFDAGIETGRFIAVTEFTSETDIPFGIY